VRKVIQPVMNRRFSRASPLAPVPLNVAGKNRALVGMGSYLVNAVANRNGCHSGGPDKAHIPTGNSRASTASTSDKERSIRFAAGCWRC
jgi:hypothetical protein